MYIFEYHKEHGIKPDKAIANHFATDTVMIKKPLTFKQISDLLDIPVAEIQFLNPLYKREVIPFVSGEQHYLRLPVDKIAVFTSNESKIYAYATYEESKRERPFESLLASNDSLGGFRKLISKIKFHKVKKGENLKHLSRTGLLLHLIDVAPYESMDTPVEAARKIIHEVEKWSDDLAHKPRWLVLNKTDRLPYDEIDTICQAIVDELEWAGPVFKIAAINGKGTRDLMFAIMNFLEEQRRNISEQE